MDKITSIEQLKEYAQGQIVELPPFGEGQPFIARIKRPSMMALAKTGKIPNSLLSTANGLFAGNGMDKKQDTMLADVFEVMDVICDACFVEPTYSQLKEIGIELTDEQYMAVFNYTQRGIKALEPFRTEHKNSESPRASKEIQ